MRFSLIRLRAQMRLPKLPAVAESCKVGVRCGHSVLASTNKVRHGLTQWPPRRRLLAVRAWTPSNGRCISTSSLLSVAWQDYVEDMMNEV